MLPRILEKEFIVSALLILTGALIPIRNAGKTAVVVTGDGDPVFRAFLYGVYGLTFLLVFMRWKRVLHVATRDRLLLAIVGLALVSVLWSDVPSLTLRRGIALGFTTLFGIYFATRYSLKEQLRLLAWAFGIAAVLSLLFALVLPTYGTHGGRHIGAWRGIYSSKNNLGPYMDLSAVVFLINARSSDRNRWVLWAGFGLSVGLVVMSGSTTAQIVLLLLLALWPFLGALRWPYTWRIPFFIIVLIVSAGMAILLLENLETLTGVFGKDATLTGRTGLWSAVLEKIGQRPWLGYGYTGFWRGLSGESADVWRVVTWLPMHAHNGWLDLCLNLGLLGASLFVINFLKCFSLSLTWLRSIKTAEGFWPLLYLIALLVLNLTTSKVLERNNIFWVLYVAIDCSLFVQRDQFSKLGNITAISRGEK